MEKTRVGLAYNLSHLDYISDHCHLRCRLHLSCYRLCCLWLQHWRWQRCRQWWCWYCLRIGYTSYTRLIATTSYEYPLQNVFIISLVKND